MQIPSQGGVRCRQAFRRQSLRCGGARFDAISRHFRANLPAAAGGISDFATAAHFLVLRSLAGVGLHAGNIAWAFDVGAPLRTY